MACEGGCVNGGGQPLNSSEKEIKSRIKNIYDQDDSDIIKSAHRNPMIIEFYEKYLDKPGSEKSKKLLHTRYSKREGLM
jgi:iron only hydrogenase large subunit-like protein